MGAKFQVYCLSLTVLLMGCATLNPKLAQRSESAFRRHNQVASELLLAFSLIDQESALYQSLIEAEERMLAACADLNGLAIQYRDGKKVGLIRKLRVPKSIQGCEEETEQANDLLHEFREQ